MNIRKWKSIKAKGIQEGNIFFDILSFFNKDTALLFGSSFTDEDLIGKRFEEFDAMIYNTNDGGQNWKGQRIGKGKFSAFVRNGGRLLATLNSGKNGQESGTVYSSEDMGISWKSISYLKHFYIRNVFHDIQSNLYVIGKNNGNAQWVLLKNQIAGKDTWDTVSQLDPGLIATPELVSNHILYLSMSNNTPIIQDVSLNTREIRTLSFNDAYFRPYFLNAIGNEVYVTGKTKGDAVVIWKYSLDRWQEPQLMAELHASNKYPVQLHLYKGQPILLVGEVNTIGTTYYLYYKKNTSDPEWKNTVVPSSYFSPFSFYDNMIWGYSGDNEIYYFDFSAPASQ